MQTNFRIETYKFQKPVINSRNKKLADNPLGVNWPVVYLLHGNGELYIGETTSANGRMEQHLNPGGTMFHLRKKLKFVDIIFDYQFNKSAILDIEQELIRLFDYEIVRSTDRKSKYFTVLQNQNKGQSKSHNYFNRAFYQEEVKYIWTKLKKKKLATNDYDEITNDVLFKYSPYINLNEEQKSICFKIINQIMDALESDTPEKQDYTAIVNGAAGTGKTIVLLFLFRCIKEAIKANQTNHGIEVDQDVSSDEFDELNEYSKLINRIALYIRNTGRPPRIAYIAQMTSLRNTIKYVLKQFNNSWGRDALGPSELVKKSFTNDGQFEPFDIVLVDEAHRLCQRRSISWMGSFDNTCKRLFGTDVDTNQFTTIDWIIKCSKTRVLIYDDIQTVKESDIDPYQFKHALLGRQQEHYLLTQQMRCKAGMDYIEYLNDIFDSRSGLCKREIENYSLILYSDPNKLIEDIILNNKKYGLSKVTAGYGWQWDRTKYDSLKKECNKKKILIRSKRVDHYISKLKTEDDGLIIFNDKKYVRNLDYDWLLKGEPNEIGCIHTSQGYDLNYVGVLFGPEIDYVNGKIVIDLNKVKDTCISTNIKGLSPTEVEAKIKKVSHYIMNAYKVMMERGIRGCYVYAHNPGLRDYLKQFLEVKE